MVHAATFDHTPVGPWYLIGHGEVGHPAIEMQTMGLADAARHFVEIALPVTEGRHVCIQDSSGALIVLAAWPDGAPFPAWHGCEAGIDALRPFVSDETLIDLWIMEASGAFDHLEMPATGND